MGKLDLCCVKTGRLARFFFDRWWCRKHTLNSNLTWPWMIVAINDGRPEMSTRSANVTLIKSCELHPWSIDDSKQSTIKMRIKTSSSSCIHLEYYHKIFMACAFQLVPFADETENTTAGLVSTNAPTLLFKSKLRWDKVNQNALCPQSSCVSDIKGDYAS